ncbi:hypothetical protein JCM1841_004546 [Sporobolomyces salmonicolor]
MTAARPTSHEASLALASLLAAVQGHSSHLSPAAHSSPAAPNSAAPTPATPFDADTPAASSSIGAPTPGAHPALEYTSEASTYELLRALGALGPIPTIEEPALRDSCSGVSAEHPTGPVSTASPSFAPPRGRTSTRTSSIASSSRPHREHYTPQPTRSGRVPQAPTFETADPATLLFNDYFDFPSSDEEDPDFDPSSAATGWADIFVGGGGGYGAVSDWSGDEGEGEEGETLPGLTSEEFAAELALLTGDIAVNGGGATLEPSTLTAGRKRSSRSRTTSATEGARTSPRRRTTPTTSASSTATTRQPPRKRARRALSPVPEVSASDYTPPLSPSHSRSRSLSTSPPPPAPNPATALPPALPAPKKRPRAIYTPEEATARRQAQERERQAKRRQNIRDQIAGLEERVKGLEGECEEWRKRAQAAEARVGELERLWRGGRQAGEEERREPGDLEDGEGSSSDGGSYQDESIEESSSSEGEDSEADDGFVDDPGTTPASAAQATPLGLNLQNLGNESLSQLLAIVHAAAKAQGIALGGEGDEGGGREK